MSPGLVEQASQGGAELLVCRDVRKLFDLPGQPRQEILRGISLSAPAGQFASIVGPSGSGKSTLLYILGALDRPSSGTISLDGQPLEALSPRRLARMRNELIGFVFQFHFLLPEFTAVENVMMPAMIAGRARADAAPRALELLDRVGMSHRADQRSTRLSGGEAQRVAIARALINSPRLVLCDEPTGNLDTANSEIVYQLLRDLNREQAITVLVVTHDTAFAERTDRIIHLVDGAVDSDRLTGA